MRPNDYRRDRRRTTGHKAASGIDWSVEGPNRAWWWASPWSTRVCCVVAPGGVMQALAAFE
ncbi:MAG: hypothetical protein QOG97_3314 [Acidimicrobiaceae bacterium]|jgi:hypothetical protein|nr:hypothetical protein [Acidimicrobiaceae bacterium]